MHQWMDAVWMSVSWPTGNYFVVTSAATTASWLKSNSTAHSRDVQCDIAELNVPETGNMSLNFSRARGGKRSSLVYRPLHTVVFIKSQQDRWRFQSKRNQCLCRQRQPEHPRGVAQSVEKVLQSPLKTAFILQGFFSFSRCHITRFYVSA